MVRPSKQSDEYNKKYIRPVSLRTHNETIPEAVLLGCSPLTYSASVFQFPPIMTHNKGNFTKVSPRKAYVIMPVKHRKTPKKNERKRTIIQWMAKFNVAKHHRVAQCL